MTTLLMRRIAVERAMDAALILINLEVLQLALQVELVPKEHVVKILAPDRAVLVHLRSVVRWGSPWETLMTKPLERDAIYLKRHFDAEIIVLCVRR